MLNKYIRINKSPEEKERHLKKLSGLLSSSQWEEVRDEVEDALIKCYERLDSCKTHEDFIRVQSEAIALKKVANLNGLMNIVANRRHRIRPPVIMGQNK